MLQSPDGGGFTSMQVNPDGIDGAFSLLPMLARLASVPLFAILSWALSPLWTSWQFALCVPFLLYISQDIKYTTELQNHICCAVGPNPLPCGAHDVGG